MIMHTTAAIDTWLGQHAGYCNRYGARITEAVCNANREKTSDSRCFGCGGLEPEARELERHEPIVFFSEEEEIEPAPVVDPDEGDDLLDLSEIDLDPEEDELSTLQHTLLGLLGNDEPELELPPLPKKPAKRRVAVFTGRCQRCGGYMVNDPERQYSENDDEVYRCFCCGWRTSPGYEWNLQNIAQGKGQK